MPNLWVTEDYVNTTKGYRCGDSGPYETYTDKPGELFLAMQREYGRCKSKVYLDTAG
jgi:hypothetical protein